MSLIDAFEAARAVRAAYSVFEADRLMKIANVNLPEEVYDQLLCIMMWYRQGLLREPVAEYMLLDVVSKHDPVLENEFKQYFESKR